MHVLLSLLGHKRAIMFVKATDQETDIRTYLNRMNFSVSDGDNLLSENSEPDMINFHADNAFSSLTFMKVKS